MSRRRVSFRIEEGPRHVCGEMTWFFPVAPWVRLKIRFEKNFEVVGLARMLEVNSVS